jgi:hypothetical protein
MECGVAGGVPCFAFLVGFWLAKMYHIFFVMVKYTLFPFVLQGEIEPPFSVADRASGCILSSSCAKTYPSTMVCCAEAQSVLFIAVAGWQHSCSC